MQVKSIAECSHGAFCSTFDMHQDTTGFQAFVLSILELSLKTGFTLFQISAVSVMLGSETARCAVMRWTGGGGDVVAPLQTALTLLPRKPVKEHIEWKQIEIAANTK